MLFADYLVFATVLFACSVNRQSLYFLCAFALSEVFYYTDTDPVFDAITIALFFSYLALISKKIRYKLQMSLILYSLLYWFSSIDYLLFPQETYFYVIFPYIIKVVDFYVICELIRARGQYIGNSSAPRGYWV